MLLLLVVVIAIFLFPSFFRYLILFVLLLLCVEILHVHSDMKAETNQPPGLEQTP